MTYDASDRKQIRRAEKAAALADQNRRETLVALVSTPAGRRWVWERIAGCNVFETIYNSDANRMFLNEGRRQVGLELLADWMAFAPDQFIEAMREANGRRSATDAANDATSGGDPGERSISEEPGRIAEGHPGPDRDEEGRGPEG